MCDDISRNQKPPFGGFWLSVHFYIVATIVFWYNRIMKRYIILSTLISASFLLFFLRTSAQQSPSLTATLHSETPLAKNIQAGAQYVDVARITLTVSGSDIYLKGIYVATDVAGGLSNFINFLIYDTYDSTLLGTYPGQSGSPNLVEFSPTIIGNGLSKTYLARAVVASSAAGKVRVGFSGFNFATQAVPALSGIPIYGNTMTFVDYYGNPIPTDTPIPTLTPMPLSTPTPSTSPTILTPTSLGFTSLAAFNLSEGDTVSSSVSGDPDIYIANDWGYKRLFLNPVIFGFYGHLGGFANVKNVTLSTRNMLVPSGLFRNCETDDPKVYGLETTGEDTGILHWVNTSGEQAVADDPDFFKKVFCINSNEFNWYQQGSAYTSVSQVPSYSR